jgi:hypothetical protein
MAKVDKNGQLKAQYPESYTKGADKKKKAKPVGYRYTNKLAKQLGIKDPSKKPSASDIEKYLGRKENGKYVYSERRKNKSDIKPKEKLAKGGKTAQNYPQSTNYNEFRDLEKKAKPVGYRYNKAGLKALKIKNPYAKPTPAHIEKYLDKYVYWENRADKSDQNPSGKLAKGGKTDKKFIIEDWAGNRLFKNKTFDSFDEVDDEGDEHTYDDYYVVELKDEYAKGGKTEQTYAQERDTYNEFRDLTKTAKPVGYRYTNDLAKKLRKDVTDRPTQAHIEKYLDKGVYWENRADKSDQNPKRKLESGGDTEYAKGGVAEHGLQKGDEIVQSAKSLMIVKNDGKYYRIDVSKGTREEINAPSFAKGGQADSYKSTYFGHAHSKKNDKEFAAKRVGYRYTKKRADKLGVSQFAKPTDEHIEKYLGNGVYFENRKDKSDISRKDRYAKGGKTDQNYPQSTNYNEFRDLEKKAKPVGYRYNEDGLKALKIKNPYAKPTRAHIEKYKDKYVYWENRADKSDQNPSGKLEYGGDTEMAKGGGTRISNSEASSYAENHQPFRGNNLEAKTLENGDYVVLSYGYYPIWYWNKKENKWYQNKDKFSQTTARHITASRPTYDAQVVSRNEMDNMMAKSLEGNGFMALGGELSSFVVTQ